MKSQFALINILLYLFEADIFHLLSVKWVKNWQNKEGSHNYIIPFGTQAVLQNDRYTLSIQIQKGDMYQMCKLRFHLLRYLDRGCNDYKKTENNLKGCANKTEITGRI